MIKTKLVNFKALVLSKKHDIESRVRPLKQNLTMLKKKCTKSKPHLRYNDKKIASGKQVVEP